METNTRTFYVIAQKPIIKQEFVDFMSAMGLSMEFPQRYEKVCYKHTITYKEGVIVNNEKIEKTKNALRQMYGALGCKNILIAEVTENE